ncbi:MAG: hypothetical protein GYB52_08085 [Rhodospirillales bacterium]|nr:hypothetical protein [Rhodospirillales bacterium]MBR9816578.1 hypothetical protein [Rhodospirillales bacterium]
MKAVFLSASVPEPTSEFATDADPYLIQFAVREFMTTVLGRCQLVWGGHPAITPMVWTVCEDLGVDYAEAVKLYQSGYFEDEFPDENARFNNIVVTDTISDADGKPDLSASLRHMRERMFGETAFEAAVFIGGKQGILDEFELITSYHPDIQTVPVGAAGGAARKLALSLNAEDGPMIEGCDFSHLFHERLGISPLDARDFKRRAVTIPAPIISDQSSGEV